MMSQLKERACLSKSVQGRLRAGGSCVEKQQPTDLCVTEPGQRRQESFVPVRESLQVLGDELRFTERSTESMPRDEGPKAGSPNHTREADESSPKRSGVRPAPVLSTLRRKRVCGSRWCSKRVWQATRHNASAQEAQGHM